MEVFLVTITVEVKPSSVERVSPSCVSIGEGTKVLGGGCRVTVSDEYLTEHGGKGVSIGGIENV
jgi:hypothetical protein